ncbi:hypothetical protein AGMMS50256_34070 [Betaproteobacteria bacterium]|nr:hypothetical protein AGMMS50256_34070 [Betaproteobacteria bacterium]
MSETQDSAEVGKSWERRFEILERTGTGESLKAYLGSYKLLTYRERLRVGFNIWGIVFGPIYYFCKKMWLKGAFLLGVMWTWGVALSLAEFAIGRGWPSVIYYLPAAAACSSLANYDYYRLRVKGERFWGGLPEFFSGKLGAIGFPCLAFLALVVATALNVKDDPQFDAPGTISFDTPPQLPTQPVPQTSQQFPQTPQQFPQTPQQFPQTPQQFPQPMPQQPMQPMPQMSPGPLEGMWMANNVISAMFQGNFYVISANGQATEGGTYAINGNEMVTQVMQGQGAGQQMRYNFQAGPDGQSFTLSMPNGGASITYRKMGDLPQQQYPQQMPQQQFPQTPQYPQQMPQQYPQQMPQQYPQQQFPQMQQLPQ